MKLQGNEFLNKTDGGLDIFRNYVTTPFKLDEWVASTTQPNQRFKVTWNERYGNYAIYVEMNYQGSWIEMHRLNAIWYLKEFSSMTENEVYKFLDEEMELGILTPKKEEIEATPQEEEMLPNGNIKLKF
jgi:hypothetical protein